MKSCETMTDVLEVEKTMSRLQSGCALMVNKSLQESCHLPHS